MTPAQEYPQQIGFGAFIAPLHSPRQNPTLAFERDLEFVERLDDFGFDEVWFGEHHGIGFEIISAPEIFMAAAAQRTARIKLGTGVLSLPYHHPLIVADRMVLLDHLTRGRTILGVGPGAFPSDAHMMGIDYQQLRPRMPDALEAITRLLESDEPVTMETEWFTLRDARLNLRPYTQPRFELAMAATVSPTGPRLAGRFGGGLLSLGSTTPEGFKALAGMWAIAEAEAKRYGRTVSRADWRLVGFYHLAETEEQARRDVKYGLQEFARYFRYMGRNNPSSFIPFDMLDLDETIDHLNKTGTAIIGTPDRMVEQLKLLQEQTGGFGKYLGYTHDMANREATLYSHELFAREVMPHFQPHMSSLEAAFEFGTRGDFGQHIVQAWASATQRYARDSTAGADPASSKRN
jgi:limonene 1,2-monooxygenase